MFGGCPMRCQYCNCTESKVIDSRPTDEGERIRDGKTFDVYAGLSQPDDRSVELMGQAPLHTMLEVK